MRPFIREAIEDHIDRVLGEEVLVSASKMLTESFAPTAKNVEDALYGYIFGRTIEFAFSIIQVCYQRVPSTDEHLEIYKIIRRRAIEIKSQIKLITSR